MLSFGVITHTPAAKSPRDSNTVQRSTMSKVVLRQGLPKGFVGGFSSGLEDITIPPKGRSLVDVRDGMIAEEYHPLYVVVGKAKGDDGGVKVFWNSVQVKSTRGSGAEQQGCYSSRFLIGQSREQCGIPRMRHHLSLCQQQRHRTLPHCSPCYFCKDLVRECSGPSTPVPR